TALSPLSLHAALPIFTGRRPFRVRASELDSGRASLQAAPALLRRVPLPAMASRSRPVHEPHPGPPQHLSTLRDEPGTYPAAQVRSEEHTSELQSRENL